MLADISSLRSLSVDAADILIEKNGVLDRDGARQSIEVVRVEHMLVRLRPGRQAWRWVGRAPLKDQLHVVTRQSLVDRCVVRSPAPGWR